MAGRLTRWTVLAGLVAGLAGGFGCGGDGVEHVARLSLDVAPCFAPPAEGHDYLCGAALEERLAAAEGDAQQRVACLAVQVGSGAPSALALSLHETEDGARVFRPTGAALQLSVTEGATARFRLFVFEPGAEGEGCAGLSPDSECAQTAGCLFALGAGEVVVTGDGEIPVRYGAGELPCGVECNDSCEVGQPCWRVCFDADHPPTERCDGVDNDCDGEVDEGFVYEASGRAVALGAACAMPGVCGDGVVECDQGDPTKLTTLCSSGPGGSDDRSGAEQCNGLDDDCDGALPVQEQDLDGDTYLACADPPDCADEVDTIYPGAPEICDGEDNDCDGVVPDDELDPDDDGSAECAGDCAPADPSVHPGAEERCDGEDNNCDSVIDEGFVYEQPLVGETPAGVLALGEPCRAPGVCGVGAVECAAGDADGLTTVCSSGPGGSASLVTAEECNGLDDDCDGDLDDDVAPPGEFGCLEVGLCAGTQPTCAGAAGWTCPYPGGHELDVELTCDGLDNDCDGAVDEDLAVPPALDCLEAGVCAERAPLCGGAQGWQCGYPATHEPEAELTCDGLDNDCDGALDEDLVAPGALCLGAGVCAGTAPSCDGVQGWQCPYGEGYEADQELACDGLDNDCDGVSDEDLVPPEGTCLTAGVCAAVAISCAGDAGWACDYPEAYQPGGELDCDGLDNDCDGTADEDFDPPLALQQLGVCAGSTQVCAGEGGWAEPDYGALPDYEAEERSCDGLDNDCDGAVDEDVTVPDGHCPTAGVCAETVARCMGPAGWFCEHPLSYQVQERTCDGLDNDCDGAVDEDLEAPAGVCPDAGVCLGAPVTCAAEAGWVCEVPEDVYEADQELTCDGLDNDCDGLVDEGLPGALADVQAGVCEGATKVCRGAEWAEPDYTTLPGYEASERTCDGDDNDCDGAVDEGLVGGLADEQRGVCNGARKVCAAGQWSEPDYTGLPNYEQPETACDDMDNDCDGVVDEDLLDPCNGCGEGLGCDAACGQGGWTCLDLGAGLEPVCEPAVRLLAEADFAACSTNLTRASSASSVDPAGIVRVLADDELRFELSPPLAEPVVLLEPAGSNLLVSSEDLGRPAWSGWGGTSVTLNTDHGAPTGPADVASRVLLPAWASISQTAVPSGVAPGVSYVLSFWARAGSLDRLRLEQHPANVRLGDEPVLTNDWQRFVYPFERGAPVGDDPGGLRLTIRNNSNIEGTVYLWGMQLEEAGFVSSYIPHPEGGDGQRSADVLTLDATLASPAAGTWAGWVKPLYAADEALAPVELMALDPLLQLTYVWDAQRSVGTLECTSGGLASQVAIGADLWEAGEWIFVSCGWQRAEVVGEDELSATVWTPGSLRPRSVVGDLGFPEPLPALQLRPAPQGAHARDLRLYRRHLSDDELRDIINATRAEYGR